MAINPNEHQPTGLGAEVTRLSLESGGRPRQARVVVPHRLGERPRLYIFFHGSLQNSAVLRRFTGGSFDRLAVQRGAIIAYPDGVSRHFNDVRRELPEEARRLGIDDVAFTRDLIDRLCADYGADRAAVVGLGFSNGGEMVMRILREAPGLLAAAVVFAATWPAPGHELPASQPAPQWRATPMMFLHGTADPVVPYGGGLVGLDPGRSRGLGTPAPESAELFARANGIAGAPELSEPAEGVELASWQSDTAPVELWTLLDAGHVIPCGVPQRSRLLGPDSEAIDAAEAVGGFFDRIGLD